MIDTDVKGLFYIKRIEYNMYIISVIRWENNESKNQELPDIFNSNTFLIKINWI